MTKKPEVSEGNLLANLKIKVLSALGKVAVCKLDIGVDVNGAGTEGPITRSVARSHVV